jgi:tetratricopeptide (TPR) repeat protein
LHSLASNAITQHQFRDAEQYLKDALAVGEKQFVSTLLLTDVQLERGQRMAAKQNLKQIASAQHFDYLIRAMKYEDEVDNLDGAIQYMEQAAAKAEKTGNAAILNWSYSNLADMYGHAGRIKKSYQTYLKALSYNPADLHSLKGIAWVAFSHDHNTTEAKRILTTLKELHPIPDYDLLLAEIATYEQKPEQAQAYENAFVQKASNPLYGKMYQTYLTELDAKSQQARIMAEAEVADRPHPVLYDLLAWTEYQNGNTKTAIDLLERHVLEQTGEPIAAYHAGIVFKANGQEKEAKKYLKQAQDAAFELGPVLSMEVNKALQEL